MFLDPGLPLVVLDGVLLALLVVGLPLQSVRAHRRDRQRAAAGEEANRMRRYRVSLVALWLLTLAVCGSWAWAGRPWAALGLLPSLSPRFLVCAALSVAASGLLLAQVVVVRRSPEAQASIARQRQEQAGLDRLMPRTLAEKRTFQVLAVTAGITEEVLFRGFLIWALAHAMPLPAAAAGALAIFAIGHLYQDSRTALLRVTAVGAVFTALSLAAGSLLPAMLVHAMIDLTSGELLWMTRDQGDDKNVSS